MVYRSTAHAITDQPTAILPGQRITVYNLGPARVFVGGSDVTSSTGTPLDPDATWSDTPIGNDLVYLVCAQGLHSECRLIRSSS